MPQEIVIHNPAAPYTGPINGGIVDGRSVTVAGVPNKDVSRFTIELKSTRFTKIIPFHFDVRIDFGNTKNVVVRNAYLDVGWGNEEREQPFFPFTRNEPFNMVIENVGDGFQVWVNGQRYVHFEHRYKDFVNIDLIHVETDLAITEVRTPNIEA